MFKIISFPVTLLKMGITTKATNIPATMNDDTPISILSTVFRIEKVSMIFSAFF